MNPHGTVCLLINFITSIVMCLYLTAQQDSSDAGGIVTAKDILDDIVGSIRQEYDSGKGYFPKTDKSTIICNASLDMEDALKLSGPDK